MAGGLASVLSVPCNACPAICQSCGNVAAEELAACLADNLAECMEEDVDDEVGEEDVDTGAPDVFPGKNGTMATGGQPDDVISGKPEGAGMNNTGVDTTSKGGRALGKGRGRSWKRAMKKARKAMKGSPSPAPEEEP